MPLPAGTRIGPYDIVAPLGSGGMGEVYRARDTRLGRDIAIKVIALGTKADADHLLRFEQEARATAALNHPNILAVHDVGGSEVRTLHRVGAARGAVAAPGAGARPVVDRKSAQIRAADRPRSGRGASQRDRPSRSEAGESLRHLRRPDQDSGFRPCQADGAEEPGRRRPRNHRDRRGGRHRRLHVARAGTRRSGRSAIRHLQFRSHRLRDALRPAGVSGKLGCRDAVRHPDQEPPGTRAGHAGTPARHRAHRGAVPGEKAGRPFSSRGGPRLRARIAVWHIDRGAAAGASSARPLRGAGAASAWSPPPSPPHSWPAPRRGCFPESRPGFSS